MRLVDFIKKKFVTMHGHMNVKLQRFVEKIIRSLLEYDVRDWLFTLKGNILRSVFFELNCSLLFLVHRY